MSKATDVAYVAGIIDGEGCIRVKKTKPYRCQGRATPGYDASVQVKMVDRGAVEFVCKTIGGWVYLQKSGLKSGRDQYTCQATGRQAEDGLRLVLPYLRVKRRQAELVLQLREFKKDSQKHRTKITGYRNFPNRYGTPRQIPVRVLSDDYVAECERLFLACKKLNRVGKAALED